MIKPAAAMFVAMALLSQGTQPFPSFAGRWRLADAVVPKDAALELVITENPSRPGMSVLRRLEGEVRGARFTVIPRSTSLDRPATPRPGSAFPNSAVQLGQALVLNAAAALGNTAGVAGRHEEVWSLNAGRDLLAEVTERPAAGPSRTTRLTYQRIPRPALGNNLLENFAADQKFAFWLRAGEASVETCDGNPCFTIRSGGGFQQYVILPEDAEGKYVVLIGSVASERVQTDGPVTGVPYLYGLVGTEDGVRYVAYLQSPELRSHSKMPNEWVGVSGVFKLPAGSSFIAFDLKQGAVKDIPHNGSAARFDDLGVHVFATEAEARTFIANWRGRTR